MMTETADGITSAEGRLLSVQMHALKDDVKEIKGELSGIRVAMDTLVRMEEKQSDLRGAITRAFEELKAEREARQKLEEKVTGLSAEMPSYRELRRWVIGGICAGILMMGTALFKLTISDPLERGYRQPTSQLQSQAQHQADNTTQ